MPDAVTPFRLDIGDDQLGDLQQRLARARWPEPPTVTDGSQGVPVDWLRDLCAYWQDGYDWRRCEAQLNALPQFTTGLDGLGIHFNPEPMDDLTAFEQRSLADVGEMFEWGTGYAVEQGTRPQTLGYALVDSPVGQAAWIAEKYWAWTDHDGDPTSALSRDQMLDNVMV